MLRLSSIVCVLAAFATFACGDETVTDTGPCAGVSGNCVEIAPGPDGRQQAQTALIDAQSGDTIVFLAGVHEFDRGLSLDVDGVTVRGEGMDESILSFATQTDGAQGFLVTADEFTIEDLAIEDTVGDGLKIEGTSGVYIRRVRVEWTGEASEENGAYGLYPVQTRNVLIEDSVVEGASDAGIYVGQSETIIVRRNRAEFNVAGIEIENSSDADVYDNVATHNTGGLLIFDLPGLQVKNGGRIRAFDNEIVDNNTDNFAPEGNIVALIPRGTGVVILAAQLVELFGNEIRDHDTISVGILGYQATMTAYDDPEYDPYVHTIDAHDNTFGAGGENYDPTNGLTAITLAALQRITDPVTHIPTVVFFGYIDPDKADPQDPLRLLPEYNLCLRNNGDADFANLDFPNEAAMANADMTPHDCEHPALPAVTIPGVSAE